jgi:hypothetical protein
MLAIIDKYISEITHSLERPPLEKLKFLRTAEDLPSEFDSPRKMSSGSPCKICQSFIVDWLTCPPSHKNPFQETLRHKALLRVAPQLALEMYRIVSSFTPTQEMLLLRQMAVNIKYIEVVHCTGLFTDSMWDVLHGMSRILSLTQVGVREDIDMLLSIVEDASLFRIAHHTDIFKWLGYCFQKLWEPIQRLHAEHSGLVPISGCGPAPGLESHGPSKDAEAILWENYF